MEFKKKNITDGFFGRIWQCMEYAIYVDKSTWMCVCVHCANVQVLFAWKKIKQLRSNTIVTSQIDSSCVIYRNFNVFFARFIVHHLWRVSCVLNTTWITCLWSKALPEIRQKWVFVYQYVAAMLFWCHTTCIIPLMMCNQK